MRHWIGLILALALAAVLFFAGGWGAAHVSDLASGQHGLFSGGANTGRTGLVALAGLAVTGVLAGLLLAVPAVSPLATGLPGIVSLAWTGLLVGSYHRALTLVPLQQDTCGAGFKTLLASGVVGLVGFVLIVPLFVPSRWRRGRDSRYDDDAYTVPGLLS